MLKNIFSRTAAPNGTIFSMEHPYDKEIQVCSDEVPLGSQMANPKETYFLYRFI